MVAVKLQNFGGMVPAVDDRLLPVGNSSYCKNCWLYTGAIRGFSKPQLLYTLQNAATRRVYRIPKNYYDKNHLADSYWMEFDHIDTDVVHAPIVNDSFNRFYWASPSGKPRYNTSANIISGTGYLGNNGYFLGIPAPSVAPTVTPSGGTGVTTTRSYVYTWVSAYGEEGPPSPPVVVTGKIDDTWAVTLTAPSGTDTTGRNLTTVRIYRTVTGSSGVATYFQVADQSIATTTYSDTNTDTIVSQNNELQTTTWTAPPDDLLGMIAMPNGVIAGFREDEIWFCEPYRPHAWPSTYTLSVENPIVGLGVVGQTVVVLTTGAPYTIVGTTPGNMSLAKLASIEPCMSRGSIVSAPEGVYYASPNGLMLVSQGAVTNMSLSSFTKDKWLNFFDLTKIRATKVGTSYYCFGNIVESASDFEPTAFEPTVFEAYDYTSSRTGFIYDTVSPRVTVSLLDSTDPTMNIMTDVWSGEPFIMRDGVVYWMNTADASEREDWFWRSMVFQPTIRKNFEAMRIWFDNDLNLPVPTGPIQTGIETLPDGVLLVVRVKADGAYVFAREIRTNGELIRLPSGFKATFWQVELEGRVTVYSIEMATSAKELMSV